MGWGIGIGIGWPNSTSGGSPANIYSIVLYGCTVNDPTYIVYSINFEISPGSYYYNNPNLTSPFTGFGKEEAPGGPQFVFTNGLCTGVTIPCI